MSIADAVMMALQNNLTVRQYALQVAYDRAQVAQAEAELGPTVKLGASGEWQSQTTSTSQSTISIPSLGIMNQPLTITSASGGTTYGFSLTLSQYLYSGNALQDEVAIERATLAADQAELAAQAASVVLQTRQAYYNLSATAAQVEADQQSVNEAAENVRVAETELRAGTTAPYQVAQAQYQLASAQSTLTQDMATAVSAQITLDRLLTLPLSTIITPTTAQTLPAAPQNLDEMITLARRQRPEIAGAQANIAAVQASIDLAKSGLRPTITLSAGPQTTSADPARLPVSWAGTISMTWAIFDNGLTKAKIQAAEATLQKDQIALQQSLQTVEDDVRTYYLSLQKAAQQMRSAESQVTYAEQNLRVQNLRYRTGTGTQLDVTTAEQQAAAARSAVITATYNYNAALAGLDYAVGIQLKY